MTLDELEKRLGALEASLAELRSQATTQAEIQTSRKEIEAIVEAQVREARKADAWFRKEARILAFGLACLVFLGWVLQRVHVGTAEVAGLVGAILAALALFWRQLSRKLPP